MARRRRPRHGRPILPLVLVLAVIAGSWWLITGSDPEPEPNAPVAVGPHVPLISARPEVPPAEAVPADVSEKGANSTPQTEATAADTAPDGIRTLIQAGEQAAARNDLVSARAHFSAAVSKGASGSDLERLRAELTRIGNETIFSSRIFENDPFVGKYTIQPGDTLGKIAKNYNISAELLASVNDIRNINLIRAGQLIKIVKGPFHAVVRKGEYAMDVYLDNALVRHFKVGLGIDGSTPIGEWSVGTKLTNPTYYPPRGGDIVAADDPENPLGERWIGLEGIGGEAVGQQRYGIHGTIEPESIGSSMSLGCIRLYNEDVELLYDYLVEKQSTVRIEP